MTGLAITSYTLTSALGQGRSAHWQALSAAKGGLARARFDGSSLHSHIGEVRSLDALLPPTLSAFECRNHRLAWLALQQDGFVSAAAELRERYGADRVGVFIGTSTAGVHSTELAYRERSGADGALPGSFDYARTQNLHSVAGVVAHALQLSGPALAISTACSSSAKVFPAAYRSMQLGLCDAAVVGGVDSLCLTTLHGFNSLQLIADDVCRPADAERKGISIGEAGGFAIVERAAAVRDRPSYGTLLGYGESGDAHHMSSPHPEGLGAASAMRAALKRAQLNAADIDYVNLHGTGTQANDAAEDRGVCAVLGTTTPCSSTKGWTGHTLGAAGIVETGLALLCLENGFLPQSLNTRVKDPALQANILMQPRSAPLTRVMSNSFGFGGSNCVLIFGRGSS
jgi:3-oxoacyl-[acyl-carrier-protein] synthase-1